MTYNGADGTLVVLLLCSCLGGAFVLQKKNGEHGREIDPANLYSTPGFDVFCSERGWRIQCGVIGEMGGRIEFFLLLSNN